MKPSSSLENLLKIMEALRLPDGCPWDKKQTFESILDCLIEESYEYVDAVIKKDTLDMKEELGDILLQVVFHSQMAKEKSLFEMKDVIQGLSEKLLRRHPHVFNKGQQVKSVEDVEKIWIEAKQKEKFSDTKVGFFDAIPSQLTSLLKAKKVQKRVAEVGFDWPDFKGSLDKVKEEIQELEDEIVSKNFNCQEEEFGDLLFSMVNLARKLKISPDLALQKANYKFITRFESMYQEVINDQLKPLDLSLEEWNLYWDKIKKSTEYFTKARDGIDIF